MHQTTKGREFTPARVSWMWLRVRTWVWTRIFTPCRRIGASVQMRCAILVLPGAGLRGDSVVMGGLRIALSRCSRW